MPIYEYICEDCQTHFEKIVLKRRRRLPARSARGRRTRFSFRCSARRMAPVTARQRRHPEDSRVVAAVAVAAVAAATERSITRFHPMMPGSSSLLLFVSAAVVLLVIGTQRGIRLRAGNRRWHVDSRSRSGGRLVGAADVLGGRAR